MLSSLSETDYKRSFDWSAPRLRHIKNLVSCVTGGSSNVPIDYENCDEIVAELSTIKGNLKQVLTHGDVSDREILSDLYTSICNALESNKAMNGTSRGGNGSTMNDSNNSNNDNNNNNNVRSSREPSIVSGLGFSINTNTSTKEPSIVTILRKLRSSDQGEINAAVANLWMIFNKRVDEEEASNGSASMDRSLASGSTSQQDKERDGLPPPPGQIQVPSLSSASNNSTTTLSLMLPDEMDGAPLSRLSSNISQITVDDSLRTLPFVRSDSTQGYDPGNRLINIMVRNAKNQMDNSAITKVLKNEISAQKETLNILLNTLSICQRQIALGMSSWLEEECPLSNIIALFVAFTENDSILLEKSQDILRALEVGVDVYHEVEMNNGYMRSRRNSQTSQSLQGTSTNSLVLPMQMSSGSDQHNAYTLAQLSNSRLGMGGSKPSSSGNLLNTLKQQSSAMSQQEDYYMSTDEDRVVLPNPSTSVFDAYTFCATHNELVLKSMALSRLSKSLMRTLNSTGSSVSKDKQIMLQNLVILAARLCHSSSIDDSPTDSPLSGSPNGSPRSPRTSMDLRQQQSSSSGGGGGAMVGEVGGGLLSSVNLGSTLTATSNFGASNSWDRAAFQQYSLTRQLGRDYHNNHPYNRDSRINLNVLWHEVMGKNSPSYSYLSNMQQQGYNHPGSFGGNGMGLGGINGVGGGPFSPLSPNSSTTIDVSSLILCEAVKQMVTVSSSHERLLDGGILALIKCWCVQCSKVLIDEMRRRLCHDENKTQHSNRFKNIDLEEDEDDVHTLDVDDDLPISSHSYKNKEALMIDTLVEATLKGLNSNIVPFEPSPNYLVAVDFLEQALDIILAIIRTLKSDNHLNQHTSDFEGLCPALVFLVQVSLEGGIGCEDTRFSLLPRVIESRTASILHYLCVNKNGPSRRALASACAPFACCKLFLYAASCVEYRYIRRKNRAAELDLHDATAASIDTQNDEDIKHLQQMTSMCLESLLSFLNKADIESRRGLDQRLLGILSTDPFLDALIFVMEKLPASKERAIAIHVTSSLTKWSESLIALFDRNIMSSLMRICNKHSEHSNVYNNAHAVAEMTQWTNVSVNAFRPILGLGGLGGSEHDQHQKEDKMRENNINDETMTACLVLANICEFSDDYAYKMYEDGMLATMLALSRKRDSAAIQTQVLRNLRIMCKVMPAITDSRKHHRGSSSTSYSNLIDAGSLTPHSSSNNMNKDVMKTPSRGNTTPSSEISAEEHFFQPSNECMETLEVLASFLNNSTSTINDVKESIQGMRWLASKNENLLMKIFDDSLRTICNLMINPQQDKEIRAEAELVIQCAGFAGGKEDFQLVANDFTIFREWYSMHRMVKVQEAFCHYLVQKWVHDYFATTTIDGDDSSMQEWESKLPIGDRSPIRRSTQRQNKQRYVPPEMYDSDADGHEDIPSCGVEWTDDSPGNLWFSLLKKVKKNLTFLLNMPSTETQKEIAIPVFQSTPFSSHRRGNSNSNATSTPTSRGDNGSHHGGGEDYSYGRSSPTTNINQFLYFGRMGLDGNESQAASANLDQDINADNLGDHLLYEESKSFYVWDLLDFFYPSRLQKMLILDLISLGTNIMDNDNNIGMSGDDGDKKPKKYMYFKPQPHDVFALELPSMRYDAFFSGIYCRIVDKMLSEGTSNRLWALVFRNSTFEMDIFTQSILGLLRKNPQILALTFRVDSKENNNKDSKQSKHDDDNFGMSYLGGEVPSSIRFLTFYGTLHDRSVSWLCKFLNKNNMSFNGRNNPDSKTSAFIRNRLRYKSANGLIGLAIIKCGLGEKHVMDIIEYLVACTHCDTEENIMDTSSQGGSLSGLSGANTPTSPPVTSWDIVYRKHLENMSRDDLVNDKNGMDAKQDNRSEFNHSFGSNLSEATSRKDRGLRLLDVSMNDLSHKACADLLLSACVGPLEGLDLGGNDIRSGKLDGHDYDTRHRGDNLGGNPGRHASQVISLNANVLADLNGQGVQVINHSYDFCERFSDIFCGYFNDPKRNRLRHLGLNRNNLTIDCFCSLLQSLTDNCTLTSVDFSNNYLESNAEVMQSMENLLAENGTLRNLDFSGNNFDDEVVDAAYMGIKSNADSEMLLLNFTGNVKITNSVSYVGLAQILISNRKRYADNCVDATQESPHTSPSSTMRNNPNVPVLPGYEAGSSSGVMKYDGQTVSLLQGDEDNGDTPTKTIHLQSEHSSGAITSVDPLNYNSFPLHSIDNEDTIGTEPMPGPPLSLVSTPGGPQQPTGLRSRSTSKDMSVESNRSRLNSSDSRRDVKQVVGVFAEIETEVDNDDDDLCNMDSSNDAGVLDNTNTSNDDMESELLILSEQQVRQEQADESNGNGIIYDNESWSDNARPSFEGSPRVPTVVKVISSASPTKKSATPVHMTNRFNRGGHMSHSREDSMMSWTDSGTNVISRDNDNKNNKKVQLRVDVDTSMSNNSSPVSPSPLADGTYGRQFDNDLVKQLDTPNAAAIQHREASAFLEATENGAGDKDSERENDKKKYNNNRNTLNVFFASPLAWKERGNHRIRPIPQVDTVKERDVIIQTFAEIPRNVTLMFEHISSEIFTNALNTGIRTFHYSGHGHSSFIMFEDGRAGLQTMDALQLKKTLEATGNTSLEFVFVSACNSSLMGQVFVDYGVKHVVCIDVAEKVQDTAATEFTRSFYLTLLSGSTVSRAFQVATTNLENASHIYGNKQEVGKFKLIPEDIDHDIVIFDAKEVKHWPGPGQCVYGYHHGEEKAITDNIDSLLKKYPPPPPPEFEGREIDMYNAITTILQHNLITLIGEAGIGKTALACSVCSYMMDRRFTCVKDGIVFLRAEHSKTFIEFLKAILLELEKRFPGEVDIVEDKNNAVVSNAANDIDMFERDRLESMIISILSNKKMLLVIDDIDHFLKNGLFSTDLKLFMTHMLEDDPNVKIFVTSSMPLELQHFGVVERSITLNSLPLPNALRLYARYAPPLRSVQLQFVSLIHRAATSSSSRMPNNRQTESEYTLNGREAMTKPRIFNVLKAIGGDNTELIIKVACESTKETIQEIFTAAKVGNEVAEKFMMSIANTAKQYGTPRGRGGINRERKEINGTRSPTSSSNTSTVLNHGQNHQLQSISSPHSTNNNGNTMDGGNGTLSKPSFGKKPGKYVSGSLTRPTFSKGATLVGPPLKAMDDSVVDDGHNPTIKKRDL